MCFFTHVMFGMLSGTSEHGATRVKIGVVCVVPSQ